MTSLLNTGVFFDDYSPILDPQVLLHVGLIKSLLVGAGIAVSFLLVSHITLHFQLFSAFVAELPPAGTVDGSWFQS